MNFLTRSFKFSLLFSVIMIDCSQISAREIQADILKGVTIRNWPYADRMDGKFQGFVVDLMNEIADTVGFEYRLYFSPDGKYGAVVDNRVNGMIGEVYNNRADFAIADISVTDIRKKYVDFTEPFIETGVGILIHKNNARNIRSFKDLADQTDIKYGTYRMSTTANFFAQSTDPVVRKMHEQMTKNPDVFVSNAKEGVDKVNATKYAFLVEGSFAELMSKIYCDLVYIRDPNNYFPRQYAIAMPKDSIYTQKFSAAIKKLKTSGQLDRMKTKYWKDRCAEEEKRSNKINNNKSNKPEIIWADKGYDTGIGVSNLYSNNLLLIFSLIFFYKYFLY